MERLADSRGLPRAKGPARGAWLAEMVSGSVRASRRRSASGFSLAGKRLPEGYAKAGILRAISSAQTSLPLAIILRIVGLEPGRFHAWRQEESVCELTDR